MPNHSLLCRCVAVTGWLCLVNNFPHLLPLFVCQLYVPTSPILFQPLRLCRSGDSNHALGSNPCQRDLRCCAALSLSKFLDLLDNCLVLVEVLALELGDRATEVVRCKVVWRGIVEVIHKPAVAKWRVGDVGHIEFPSGVDQTVGFMQCLEGRVFCLDSIDFGNLIAKLADCRLTEYSTYLSLLSAVS